MLTSTNSRPCSRRLRVSNVVYFETAFSSARAWSIWSSAYVTISAVVIVSPLRASDFVGLVAEDIAQVSDRRVDLGERQQQCSGLNAKPAMVAAGCVASEPVQKGGEDSQRGTDHGGVARVVEIADRQRASSRAWLADRRVRLQLEPAWYARVRLVETVAAVLSDPQAPTHGTPARGRDRRRGRRCRRRPARTRSHTGCGWLRRLRSGRSRRPSPRQGNRPIVNAKTRAALVMVWVSRPRASWARHHSTAPFGLADEAGMHCRADPGRRRAPRRGHCRQPSARRRCGRQPPRSVPRPSTATRLHTGTRAGDDRRRGRVR